MKKNISKSHILNTNEGFTLIEVLIAITILSILMATMYTIVNDSTESKDRIIAEDRDALQLVTALDRMERDFSQFYSPLYHSAKYSKSNTSNELQFGDINSNDPQKKADPLASYIPTERFPSISTSGNIVPKILNESKSEISFLTSANRRILENSKQSSYAWVKYTLRSMPQEDESIKEGADFVLTRAVQSENIYNKDFDWDNAKEYTLLKDIKSFQFLFWNEKTEKFVDTLEMMSTDQETPRLIKVKIVWINIDNNEIVIERTFRPLFPFFDTKKDEKEKELARKSAQKPGEPSGTPEVPLQLGDDQGDE